MAGLSFKFSKKTVVKLTTTNGSKFKNDEEIENSDGEDELKKFKARKITALDEFGFKTIDDDDDSDKQKSSRIVIPALANTLQFQPSATNLDDLARNALIEDGWRLKNGSGYVQETTKIELTSLGNGEITENRRGGLDFSELPDVSGEADYDAVPVHAYGKALLRGLGWEEGQPIGKNVKNTVAPVVTAPRPKGLGLGAQIVKPPAANKDNSSADKSKNIKKEEELVLKVGSYFKTIKEEYGEIVGLDEDNARIMGRLTLSKSTVTLSQHGVRLVTKEEYEKFSKVINKEKYDKYKKEEDEKESRRRDKLKNDNERKTDEDEKKSRQRDDPKRDN
jgi:G patch domain/KOW motif-containing protein